MNELTATAGPRLRQIHAELEGIGKQALDLAIEAGIVRVRSPLEMIVSLIPKLDPAERRKLVAMLTGKEGRP